MNGGQHVDPLDLVAYARGALHRAPAARVREHCRTCVECGDQLAAVMLLRRRAGVRPLNRRPSRLAAAAGIAVVALGAGVLWFSGTSGSVDTAGSVGTIDVPVAATPRVDPRSDPSIMAMVTYIGRELDPGTVASADAGTAAAGRALVAGDYGRAVDLLRAAPEGVEELLGLALYFDGRADEAREVLEAVVSPPAAGFGRLPHVSRLATYLLAAAYVEIGDLEAARRFLDTWEPAANVDPDRIDRELSRIREELSAHASP